LVMVGLFLLHFDFSGFINFDYYLVLKISAIITNSILLA
jgi:hypothetical protein